MMNSVYLKALFSGTALCITSLLISYLLLSVVADITYIEMPPELNVMAENLTEDNIDEYNAKYDQAAAEALELYEANKVNYYGIVKFRSIAISFLPWLAFGFFGNIKKEIYREIILFIPLAILTVATLFFWWEGVIYISSFYIGNKLFDLKNKKGMPAA